MAGIRISNPDRVVFPDRGLSKLDLARYMEQVAPWMLRHVARRPLTLLWCPRGVVAEGCSFMRHSKVWGPPALRRVKIREKTKIGEYLVIDDDAGLVALAQMGVVEIHTWNTSTDDVERPDRMVFDLDPGPAVPWRRVVEASFAIRRGLAALGLESWVKTTGGVGLHVVVPIVPRLDVAECLAFARAFATAVASHHPDRFTVAMAKEGRAGLILIDYLRNNRTNTAVAAYSPRARAGAPVSMPLAWDELSLARRPAPVPVDRVVRRLRSLRADPWAGYFETVQDVADDVLRALVPRGP